MRTLQNVIDDMIETYPEKAMRMAIYISGQLKEAKEIEEAASVYDLVDAPEDKYMLVFKGDKSNEYDFANMYDISTQSPFIDGDWGYWDEDETTFYPICNYGKTWAAIPYVEATAEAGWPIVSRVVSRLSSVQN